MKPHSTVPFPPWVVCLLAGVFAFLVYLPSLHSGLVYDARSEILIDPVIRGGTSHLGDVLSLHILSTSHILGPRPVQLLYLMLSFQLWGENPVGYHFASNLLHAANSALFCLLILRLIGPASTGWPSLLVPFVATMLFTLHPIQVESVTEISYSSVLLSGFFTLAALVLATCFHGRRSDWFLAALIPLAAVAASAAKETGLVTPLLLTSYWILYRRSENKKPWLGILSASWLLSLAFISARYYLALPSANSPQYLAGSFFGAVTNQPRLWVFMLGKILSPVGLSADYNPINVAPIAAWFSYGIILVFLALQIWLALLSRLAAMGLVIFWATLLPVSNFIPIFRPLADRFYYLPLAGLLLQLTGFLLLPHWPKSGRLGVIVLLLGVMVPLAWLNETRQAVFANSLVLWTDTLRISPTSITAADNLGYARYDDADYPGALQAFATAEQLTDQKDPDPWLGTALTLQALNRRLEATAALRQAIVLDSSYAHPVELNARLILEPRYNRDMQIILDELK